MSPATQTLREPVTRMIDALNGPATYPWNWIAAHAAADRILAMIAPALEKAREDGRRHGIEQAIEAMNHDDTSFQSVLNFITRNAPSETDQTG